MTRTHNSDLFPNREPRNYTAGKPFRVKHARAAKKPDPKACHACYREHEEAGSYCPTCIGNGAATFHTRTVRGLP